MSVRERIKGVHKELRLRVIHGQQQTRSTSALLWRVKYHQHFYVQLKYTNMEAGNEWQHLQFTAAIYKAFLSW